MELISILEVGLGVLFQTNNLIDRIEPYKDSGKFIIHLKNKKTVSPIELDKGKKELLSIFPLQNYLIMVVNDANTGKRQ
jgi:hypothetical protein